MFKRFTNSSTMKNLLFTISLLLFIIWPVYSTPEASRVRSRKGQRRQDKPSTVTHPVVHVQLDEESIKRFNEFGVVPFMHSGNQARLNARRDKVSNSNDYEDLVIQMPILRPSNSRRQQIPYRFTTDLSSVKQLPDQPSYFDQSKVPPKQGILTSDEFLKLLQERPGKSSQINPGGNFPGLKSQFHNFPLSEIPFTQSQSHDSINPESFYMNQVSASPRPFSSDSDFKSNLVLNSGNDDNVPYVQGHRPLSALLQGTTFSTLEEAQQAGYASYPLSDIGGSGVLPVRVARPKRTEETSSGSQSFFQNFPSLTDWIPELPNFMNWGRSDQAESKQKPVISMQHPQVLPQVYPHNFLPQSPSSGVKFSPMLAQSQILNRQKPIEFPTPKPPSNPIATVSTGESIRAANSAYREINFPSSDDIQAFNPEFNETLATGNGRCDLRNGQALHGDKCSMLLSQGPCLDQHWLVLLETGLPVCAHRKCSWDKLLYKGRCVDPLDHTICGKGQIFYVDLFGKTECDCEENRVYEPESGNCYAQHEKGFCQMSEHIEIARNGAPVCVTNPCYGEDLVQYDGRCYKKLYDGVCPESQLVLKKAHGTAECDYIIPHSIFGVGIQTACPSGSRRGFLRQCRSVFRVPTQKTFPKQRGECPSSFFGGFGNTCRKTVGLFG